MIKYKERFYPLLLRQMTGHIEQPFTLSLLPSPMLIHYYTRARMMQKWYKIFHKIWRSFYPLAETDDQPHRAAFYLYPFTKSNADTLLYMGQSEAKMIQNIPQKMKVNLPFCWDRWPATLSSQGCNSSRGSHRKATCNQQKSEISNHKQTEIKSNQPPAIISNQKS